MIKTYLQYTYLQYEPIGSQFVNSTNRTLPVTYTERRLRRQGICHDYQECRPVQFTTKNMKTDDWMKCHLQSSWPLCTWLVFLGFRVLFFESSCLMWLLEKLHELIYGKSLEYHLVQTSWQLVIVYIVIISMGCIWEEYYSLSFLRS